jgi:hypothetical protein
MSVPDESIQDDQQLVRYLLGLFPEEEAERFDEQSIVVDEFAVRLQCVENDLVDAYVSGTLEGDILKRFESFYLASPLRREKVKFAERLLASADRASASAPGPRKPRGPAPRRSRRFGTRWKPMRASPPLANGAVAAAAAICWWPGSCPSGCPARRRVERCAAGRRSPRQHAQELANLTNSAPRTAGR